MALANPIDRLGFVLEKYKDGDQKLIDLLGRVKKALETSEMSRVPANQIRRYKDQPRKFFDPASLQRMANSIDNTAQIQAGMVRKLPRAEWEPPVRYELIDGERRWRGVNLIPAERRPLFKAEIIEADNEVVQFLIAGMANFNREGHQPLETADTIHRYHVEFKIPMEAVADLLGISSAWAYQIHGLRQLPAPVKKMLDPEASRKERLPLSAAIHISKLPNPEEQQTLARSVVKGDITLSRLRAEVVRIAEKTGTPIRLREVAPLKKWDGRDDKVRGMLRLSSNLESILNELEIQQIMRAHRGEARELQRQIGVVRTQLSRCEALIQKALT